ncbi:MAG TPA: ketopantoate reductase family protein [Thermomicrobiaceae bacterium]|nr:ketopantoate reductase family protein [Thermomicrobiaceae bacterium]
MASSTGTARQLDVLIYGSGAVGSYFGAALAESGVRVTLLCRERQADQLRRRGVTLLGSSSRSRIEAHPTIITSIDQLAHQPDIVLVCTKAYDVEPALPGLLRLGRSGALIILVQNGIGSEELLLANTRPRQLSLAAASLTVSVDRRPDGDIRTANERGGLALAVVREDSSTQDRLSWLTSAFTQAGLTSLILDRWQPMKWSKLLLNLLGNATSAILAMPPGDIYRDPRLFALERAAFFEALATMLGSGWFPVGLPGFNVPLLTQLMRLPPALGRRLLASRVGGGRGAKRPSLWIDVERSRVPTEAGWLNGAVAREAERLGIPAPVNRRLAELVDQLAAGEIDRSRFAGHPDALLRELGI